MSKQSARLTLCILTTSIRLLDEVGSLLLHGNMSCRSLASLRTRRKSCPSRLRERTTLVICSSVMSWRAKRYKIFTPYNEVLDGLIPQKLYYREDTIMYNTLFLFKRASWRNTSVFTPTKTPGLAGIVI